MAESLSKEKIYLKDYKKPLFSIPNISLTFDLFEDKAIVTSLLSVQSLANSATFQDLILNGENLKLVQIELNDKVLTEKDYLITAETLTVKNFPSQGQLKIITEIEPHKNTALEGLYKSAGGFCTQNEPQGFRKITYFKDRPDIMSKYDVVIRADKKKYPILLSNGNCISQEDLGDGRHQAQWQDPWPKPCYLFALVAGDYGLLKDQFITRSGKKVSLEIYCNHGQESRCHHAMESLKKSMKWDEEKYGREYDLDRYMILAVDDFNAGAMENKGLNIFNSRLVLASPETATDADYEAIEAVIAHEYFHNWTGNRVTLRDWFHLSLKEGLTVFRDQQFTADQTSPGVKRIDDVQGLRAGQFTEDDGPNAHPVRPASVIAVDNFFTATIYEKGSEVIRMISSMIGPQAFRQGMDIYFDRHDGKAVTIEDFVKCFEEVSGLNLFQFRRWYEQAGTPEVKISDSYDYEKSEYKIILSQSCAPTPNQPEKHPFHIPIKVGLLDDSGHEIEFEFEKSEQSETNKVPGAHVLHLKNPLQTFTVKGLKSKPHLSPLRDFSAPVNLKWNASTEELLFLATYDSDGFNRWEAGQKIFLNELLNIYEQTCQKKSASISPELIQGISSWIKNGTDHALTATMLSLPGQDYFLQKLKVINPQAVIDSYTLLEQTIAHSLRDSIKEKLLSLTFDPNDLSFKAVSIRSLYGRLLMLNAYNPDGEKFAYELFKKNQSMTMNAKALSALNQRENPFRLQAFSEFFETWKKDPVVLNKYFQWIASFESVQTINSVKAAMSLPEFRLQNPNNVYRLLGTFSWGNLSGYNLADGSGYQFMREQILAVDKLNPQVAARLCGCFEGWKKLTPELKDLAGKEIQIIVSAKDLSKNTFELIKNTFEN